MNDKDIIYTAYFVDDTEALREQFPSQLPNKYYDHMTLEFRPSEKHAELDRLGEKYRMRVLGRLITETVDVLMVIPPHIDMLTHNFIRTAPHITLATANGIQPKQSGVELYNYITSKPKSLNKRWETLNVFIDVTLGVFTSNKGKVTEKNNL